MTSPLYTDLLLEHARHPRHTTRLPEPTSSTRADNPLCGDWVELDLAVVAGHVRQVSVRVRGCAVAVGAGSLAAEVFHGRPTDELAELSALWRSFLVSPPSEAPRLPETLAPCRALLSVRLRPSRRACALLAWDALDLAMAALHPSACEYRRNMITHIP